MMHQIQTEIAFVRIGVLDDFPVGLGREVRLDFWDLAIFRTTDDRLFALENRTPHPKGGTLTEAIVSGDYIYCPIRDLKIALKDGRVQAPDSGQAQTFIIQLDEGVVHVGIPKENDRLVTCEQCGKYTGDGPVGKNWVCKDCRVSSVLPKKASN